MSRSQTPGHARSRSENGLLSGSAEVLASLCGGSEKCKQTYDFLISFPPRNSGMRIHYLNIKHSFINMEGISRYFLLPTFVSH
jgi:hypothetical protein